MKAFLSGRRCERKVETWNKPCENFNTQLGTFQRGHSPLISLSCILKRKRKVEGRGRGKERKRKRKKEEGKGGKEIGSEFFLFLFLSFPLPLPSTFRLRFKISLFAFIPLITFMYASTPTVPAQASGKLGAHWGHFLQMRSMFRAYSCHSAFRIFLPNFVWF